MRVDERDEEIYIASHPMKSESDFELRIPPPEWKSSWNGARDHLFGFVND